LILTCQIFNKDGHPWNKRLFLKPKMSIFISYNFITYKKSMYNENVPIFKITYAIKHHPLWSRWYIIMAHNLNIMLEQRPNFYLLWFNQIHLLTGRFWERLRKYANFGKKLPFEKVIMISIRNSLALTVWCLQNDQIKVMTNNVFFMLVLINSKISVRLINCKKIKMIHLVLWMFQHYWLLCDASHIFILPSFLLRVSVYDHYI
jgi:hypothetical protein